MGTPHFAVESLKQLVENDFDVVGVVTAPDKPAGRGQKLRQSAVKQFAIKHEIPVLQPKNLKADSFQDELDALNANLYVVVAFRMLPAKVFEKPELGCFNLHASLLPQYRGAAPINWVVMNGETETGATTFFLKQKIDTGDIILQSTILINKSDTAGDLHDKLMIEGGQLVVETCKMIENDKVKTTPQVIKNLILKKAPKIFKEDCEIDWNQPSKKIYDFIRGLSPYPASWTHLNDKSLRIYKATHQLESHNYEIGDVVTDKKTVLRFATKDGWINCLEIQLEGKKRMKIEDFLRGYR